MTIFSKFQPSKFVLFSPNSSLLFSESRMNKVHTLASTRPSLESGYYFIFNYKVALERKKI